MGHVVFLYISFLCSIKYVKLQTKRKQKTSRTQPSITINDSNCTCMDVVVLEDDDKVFEYEINSVKNETVDEDLTVGVDIEG